MKYGLLLHNYGKSAKRMAGFNIGDPIQTVALEKIYKEMNILEENIVRIDLSELAVYKGEYVVLPMLGVAIGAGFAPLPLSPFILPVFISAHFVVSELSQEAIEYLKMYAPIGCRDEYSLNTMRKYGIPAFLSGCITAVWEKRKLNIMPKKVYIVDVPQSVEEYIPDILKKDAIRKSHLLPLEKEVMTHEIAEELYEQSKICLKEYEQNAKLVISSRLHALVPCMAMGIPVIGVFENLSYRFSWLDKYIPLYVEENFLDIDWNPDIVEYEEEKQEIKGLFINYIHEVYKKYQVSYRVSEFYEKRKRSIYGNRYRDAIERISVKKEIFDYIIWGCGLIGDNVYDIMKKKYPCANLKVAVDEYAEGKWHEVSIIKSGNLEEYPECFVILASYSGKKQGYEVMKKLGRKEFQDFIYVGTING